MYMYNLEKQASKKKGKKKGKYFFIFSAVDAA